MKGITLNFNRDKGLTADTEVGLSVEGREMADRASAGGLRGKILESLGHGPKTVSDLALDINEDTDKVKRFILKKMRGLVKWWMVA